MKRRLTKFLTTIISIISLTNISFAQVQKAPYEVIVAGNGLSSFNGNYYYVYISIFLNNNTDETLYYQGTECDSYNLIFSLDRNPYFHLADNICQNTQYSKLILPPHRSQKMQIFLTMDKEPDRDVAVKIRMKLYKWTDNKAKAQEADALHGSLSDSTVLHYRTNHQEYSSYNDFAMLKKKEESILPEKDIYLLTENDRKLYRLTTDKEKISAPRDTIVSTFGKERSRKAKVVTVPATLHNDADDTLKFCSMSCSWFEFWGTNCPDIQLPDYPCEANAPTIITILPHQEYKKNLEIIYYSNITSGNRYRISISLLKPSKNFASIWDLWPSQWVRFNKVWSNEITIR